METANAFIPHFIADYNARFAKPPKQDHDAHRAIRSEENLDLIFTWREPRRISKNLTFQYDKILYLLPDMAETRMLAGRYIDIYHYPDGHIKPYASGTPLPFTAYDRLSEVDQGAIVENKRLSHVLQMAQFVQEKRDNRRSASVPKSVDEVGSRKRGRPPGKKGQRALDENDVLSAIERLQGQAPKRAVAGR